MKKLHKLLRFMTIYGVGRSLNKAFGRLRLNNIFHLPTFQNDAHISIIGCGQFAFSTICYFLSKSGNNNFLDCFDIETKNAQSLHNFYRFQKITDTPAILLENPKLKTLYIASNHASHSHYAIEAVKKGINYIYIEKPISTSVVKFVELIAHKRKYNATLYAGYNRPFSKAIILLKDRIKTGNLPITLSCFITGHFIDKDHWYRLPDEGTRVCGNIGHWLDLSIHLLAKRNIPNLLDIRIAYSNTKEPDDNIGITLTSDIGDLISIIITARAEPFEGINETINFQQDDLTAKIDDFRRITIWQNSELLRKRFFPKDVGHKKAILQPFDNSPRDWQEVEISTLLMLYIADMVKSQQTTAQFNISDEMKCFNDSVSLQMDSINF